MNSNPLEKEIETKVCAYAKKLGVIHYKFTSPAKRSVPDRVFVLPGGRVFWIEFKRKGEMPRSAQAIEIAKLRQQGATVYIVNDVENGKRVIEREKSGDAIFDQAYMKNLMLLAETKNPLMQLVRAKMKKDLLDEY